MIFLLSVCSSLLYAPCSMLFNDPVRPHEHIWWNREPDLLGGFQVDDQLDLDRLFHLQIDRLFAIEKFVYMKRRTPLLTLIDYMASFQYPYFNGGIFHERSQAQEIFIG
jgi:hypothetical protein